MKQIENYMIKWSFTCNLVFLTAIVVLGVDNFFSGTIKAEEPHEIRRLAVLPFQAIQHDLETSYLGLALDHEVITKISYIKHIVVRPSAAVRKYEDAAYVLADVGRELDVEFVLTGEYEKEKSHFCLNVKLINVHRDKVIWDEKIDVAYDEIFTLLDIIPRKMIAKLQLQLSFEESQMLKKDIPTNLSAYEYYLKAIALKPQTVDDWADCIQLLEKSIELDSTYAPAMASLGYAYLQYSGKVGGRKGHYELAEKTLLHALNVNRELPQTLYFLGLLYAKIGRSEKSAALHLEGLKQNSNIPDFYSGLGYVYRYAGLLDESIQAYQQSQFLDSSLKNVISTQMQIIKSQIYKGDYHAARKSYDKVITYLQTMQQSADEKKLFYNGVIYLYSEDIERAIAYFDSAMSVDNTSVWSVFGQAYKEAILANNGRVLEITDQLESRDVVDGERRYRFVHFYAQIGRVEDALRNLQKSIEAGFFNYPYIRQDPLIERIKNTEKFRILLNQAKDRHDTFKQRFIGKL